MKRMTYLHRPHLQSNRDQGHPRESPRSLCRLAVEMRCRRQHPITASLLVGLLRGQRTAQASRHLRPCHLRNAMKTRCGCRSTAAAHNGESEQFDSSLLLLYGLVAAPLHINFSCTSCR